ncbi:hypothetical protein O7602_26100 [Micromonospora sp. WMMD1128]|uniref:hypothetical protein n=1 Tax=Micromonospora sp. WMMD1128 TaxID=3015150 RepID=UPI00248B62D8|nr:hypothetical protein [Micromonospora sp. WMMD1128]WBB73125.1 hypothetical protein O7602_26100 [Micromonospora sp. WMMD1128]
MLPVAFASSTWTAMLRRIARTAATTLALIAGLQGIAATPADADATTARPAAIAVTDARPASTVDAARGATVVAEAAPWAVTHPATGPSVAGPTDDAVAAPVAVVDVPAAADPGRATIARRGPPRA